MPAVTSRSPSYLALGDSMSIDLYTGVAGGGAVSQFHRWLGEAWTLDDRSADMCRMRYVPTDGRGDVITLTIGGNDLIADVQHYLEHGVDGFAAEHLSLLRTIRLANPDALFLVGNVYEPQSPLPAAWREALAAANSAIAANARDVGAALADIHGAFRGREPKLLCYDIEPSLAGATVIAEIWQGLAHEVRGFAGS